LTISRNPLYKYHMDQHLNKQEKDRYVNVTIRMEKALHQKLQELAEKYHRSVSGQITYLIKLALGEQEEEKYRSQD
jgi:hypothetical protein